MRERYVLQRLILHVDTKDRFIEAFLKPLPDLHGTSCPAPFPLSHVIVGPVPGIHDSCWSNSLSAFGGPFSMPEQP